MFGRTKVAMIVAEFLGVATITSVILAISKSGVGFSYFIASGVALAVGLFALAVGSYSGAHFNPAVTLGMWTTRKIPTTQAVVYIAAQFLGAAAAWQLYIFMVNQPLTNIAGKSFDWRVLTAEAVGAFVLTFGVASAMYQGYKGLRFAATVAGSFFLGIVIASVAANGLVNPAVALGVDSWGRAYVLGPLLGGVVGVNVYAYLFAPAEARLALLGTRGTTVSKSVVRKKTTVKVVPAKKKTTAKKTTKKTTRKK